MVSAEASIPAAPISNDVKACQHGFSTCLDDIDPNIVYASFYLLLHEGRRSNMDVLHTLCVLCSERRRGRHRVAAMSGYDFLIGF